MMSYIEYLNMPTKVAIILVAIFLFMQIVGEILEFKGKVVPEFLKIRKYFARKKAEREMVAQASETLKSVKELLVEVEKHYNDDNIALRNKWMNDVDRKFEENDKLFKELNEKLDRNNEDTLSLLIDSKRNAIISFASCVIDENYPVTREQFKRIFKTHEEYEDIIRKNGLTNGEVDIAYHIITESYESHMINHTFIEDIRGYNNNQN